MEKPLVSVVIPTYNGQAHILRAVLGATSQSYKNIEIIIINDGSRDNTLSILQKLQDNDKRISITTNKQNIGFVQSLKVGMGRALGKYVARLDDDDVWIDNQKIEKQVDFLEKNPEYVLVGGGVVVRAHSTEKEIVRYLFPMQDGDIKRALLMYNLFSHSAVLFLKSAYDGVGGYKQEFGFFADSDLWLALGQIGKLYNIQEYVVAYSDKEEGFNNYSARDKEIRRRLFLRIKMKWHYKNSYPHFGKALFFCLASYIYSFLPFKDKIKPFLFNVRVLFMGTPYKYLR